MKIGGEFKKHPRREEEPINEFQRQKADEFKKKLEEEAKKIIENARKEKDNKNKIRLICNVISPDNYEKKFKELRGYIFGDL